MQQPKAELELSSSFAPIAALQLLQLSAMHGASRRRRRRGRLHRLLRKLHAQRNSNKTSALVGLWDECIADERVPELGGAALLYWTRHGGDRAVAKSSWLPRGASPRSPLEALAYGVLRAHTPDETPQDAVAGAEYWVQIRGGNGEACGIRINKQSIEKGLGLHFDKDERAHAERGEWHHPMLASATYLTHGGAPLAIFDTTSDGQGPVRRAWLVSPQRGRHVAFLGDRLHGVPAELAPEGPYATRVSVLVNLWDKRPVGVSRAPGGEACEPFALCFAHKVTPPIAVVQPDDHLLYEHRDGDTGPIPLEKWRAEALGALELSYPH